MSETRTIQGPAGAFLIPTDWPSAEPSMRAIWAGEYSYPRERAEEVQTLVDVGANIGGFIVWARTWWPALSCIHAFEPNPSALDLCIRNTGQYPEAYAVTTNPTPRLSGTDNWGDWNVMENHGEPVLSLHPRYLPPCDALKLDCEGSEMEIIEHYPYLSACAVVLVEIHRAAFLKPIHDKLTGLGFVMKRGNPHADECDVRAYVKP